MKYVIDHVKQKEHQHMESVIYMEIDYELVTLKDALDENDTLTIIKTKEKLIYLVNKLLDLPVKWVVISL